jgi:hypothetical protein
MQDLRVSVIGGSSVTDEEYDLARRVGRELADRGHTIVCGGLTGAMEAVCEGASENDGTTIGILPGEDPAAANEYVDTVVVTGMGDARNALVALNGDGAIAIDGGYGTLSEIALALVEELPVAGLRTHDVQGIEPVSDPVAAVEYVETNARP